jgi:polysaccharide export outer membrane protein
MKFMSCILFSVVLFIVLAAVSMGVAGEYKIGAGDLLDVSVWKNVDLTRQFAVLPDGTIRFPLIGQLDVEGKSAAQLEKELMGKLEKYIPDPILTISVVQVNSMAVYVIGKVNRPGRFTLNDDIDVLQALAIAGGLNAFAREKEIGIHRKRNGETTIFKFNYKEVSEGENINQNIMLQRGDVIVVR